jgi:hypothetical protein
MRPHFRPNNTPSGLFLLSCTRGRIIASLGDNVVHRCWWRRKKEVALIGYIEAEYSEDVGSLLFGFHYHVTVASVTHQHEIF